MTEEKRNEQMTEVEVSMKIATKDFDELQKILLYHIDWIVDMDNNPNTLVNIRDVRILNSEKITMNDLCTWG